MIVKTYMGIDPGPSTGLALLFVHDDGYWEWMVFQVDGWNGAFWLIQELYAHFCPNLVAVEKFIPMNKGGTSGKDAELTRRIAEHSYQLVPTIKRIPAAVSRLRKAADVKPWATDKRLEKAGFPWGAKFKDARDAGRHVLYAAVLDGKERDPLA